LSRIDIDSGQRHWAEYLIDPPQCATETAADFGPLDQPAGGRPDLERFLQQQRERLRSQFCGWQEEVA